MIQKKVCMLGAFGVGKTSLVARFVHSRFSEQYLSTMGVKVDRKVVDIGERRIHMMLWDIYGEERNRKVAPNYMRGAAGAVLVADGTRPATLAVIDVLRDRLCGVAGDIPWVLLINKHDLVDQWAIPDAQIQKLRQQAVPVYLSSAKTGEHVEEAFGRLGRMMLDA